jgi:hypothetical protein
VAKLPGGRLSFTQAYKNVFLNSGSDYVKKELKYVSIFVYNNFFLGACFDNRSLEVTF